MYIYRLTHWMALCLFLHTYAAIAEPPVAPSKQTAPSAPPPGRATASPALIQTLVREAVATHPSARASLQRTEAARAATRSVRLWEDPMVGFGYMAAERDMQQDDGDLTAMAEQTLPRPTLFRAEKRKAEAEFMARAASVRLTTNELALAVAQASVELALADEIIRLQDENLGWLRTNVRVAEDRAKNPDATASEALRLQSEHAVQEQTVAAARRMRAQLARRLNILLGRPLTAPSATLSLPASVPALPSLQAVEAQLQVVNPQLASMRHMAEGAAAEVDVAKAKTGPVFTAGVESNTFSGAGAIAPASGPDQRSTSMTIKMSVPWFNSSANRAEIRKAERLRQAAQSDVEAEARRLLAALTEQLTEAENNRRQAAAYTTDVLPRTELASSLTADAWISSRATVTDVIDTRRTYLDALQTRARLIAARHIAYYNFHATLGDLAPNIALVPASQRDTSSPDSQPQDAPIRRSGPGTAPSPGKGPSAAPAKVKGNTSSLSQKGKTS